MFHTLAAFLLLAANAQAAPGEPDGEIVVRAGTREAVDRFVESLTQSDGGRQIARWNDHICPRVLGLDPPHAAYLIDRIGATARGLRIPVASGRCRGNVVIVMVGDADEFTVSLVARYPRLFRGPRDNLASPGEIARLLQPRPVRWIAASATGNAEGRPIVDGMNRIYSESRLTVPTREDATLSFIVVDANKLARITWAQLADYLAMVALARPAMDAGYDDGTVLSIFRIRDEGGRGPARLTRRDRALLRSLYSTNAATTAEAQRAAIRSRVARTAEPEAD